MVQLEDDDDDIGEDDDEDEDGTVNCDVIVTFVVGLLFLFAILASSS